MKITLVPCYGRDYRSKAAVQSDWDQNMDFIINTYGHRYDGKPANKEDLATECSSVFIRYDKNRKIAEFKTK